MIHNLSIIDVVVFFVICVVDLIYFYFCNVVLNIMWYWVRIFREKMHLLTRNGYLVLNYDFGDGGHR